MKVLLVADFVLYSNGVQELGLMQAAKVLGWDYKVYDFNFHNENALNIKYDLVIHAVQYLERSLALMERLKRDGCECQVLYFCDYREKYDKWEVWKEQAKYLSHIFISNREQIKKCTKELKTDTSFLPQASYIPEVEETFTGWQHDLLFIGTTEPTAVYHSKRTRILAKVKREVSFLNGEKAEDKNEIWGQMPKLYRNSKLVFDMSGRTNVEGYVSGRFFHASGYGSTTISARFKGYEEFGYKDGVHKLFFKGVKELNEKLEYYLTNAVLLEQIRCAGYEHTKKYHTYIHRMKELQTKLQL